MYILVCFFSIYFSFLLVTAAKESTRGGGRAPGPPRALCKGGGLQRHRHLPVLHGELHSPKGCEEASAAQQNLRPHSGRFVVSLSGAEESEAEAPTQKAVWGLLNFSEFGRDENGEKGTEPADGWLVDGLAAGLRPGRMTGADLSISLSSNTPTCLG